MTKVRHTGFARLTQKDVSAVAARHEMLYSGRIGGARAVFAFCDMSGLDLASSLDRDARTAGIPRIALSADAMPATIREALARGFQAYVTKPVDVRPFLATLDQAIDPLA